MSRYAGLVQTNPTRHAVKRWGERFPSRNMDAEYASAKPLGRGKRAQRLKRTLNEHHWREIVGPYRNKYFMLAKSGIVFVMAPGSVVITVLELPSE